MADPVHVCYVAEFAHSRGCFGHKSRQKPVVEVLDEVAAAARVQDGVPAIIYLDLHAEAFYISERWGADTVRRQLPVRITVEAVDPAGHGADKGATAVAIIHFKDRASSDLFGKLALQLLPEWLAMRHCALGRNLLVLNDNWLLSDQDQAIKVQRTDGRACGLLQLDLQRPSIELIQLEGGQAVRAATVSCLADAGKLLQKHSKAKLQLDRVVRSVIKGVKPSPTCISQLLARLEASVVQHKGAVPMSQWIRGGIMAALVDCASDMAAICTQHHQQCRQHPQQHYQLLPEVQPHHLPHQQQHSTAASHLSVDSTTRIAVLQGLAECCCLVLQHVASMVEQAQLLVACVRRALGGTTAQAALAAQLLHMVLRHVVTTSQNVGPALHQACCDLQLFEQLQHCYSRGLPHREPEHWSPRPLGIMASDGADEQQLQQHQQPHRLSSEQSMQHLSSAQHSAAAEITHLPSPGRTAAGAACLHSASRQLSKTVMGRSEGQGHPGRIVVPSLSLPGSACSTPAGHTSRLSQESVACASVPIDEAEDAMQEQQPAEAQSSFIKALQQLGHSCGQSMIAADLAAFVTHKQLHGGHVAGSGGVQPNRLAATSSVPADDGNAHEQRRIGFDQLSRLPLLMQLQLEVLECWQQLLHAQQPPGPSLLLQVNSLLLSHLLLPRPDWVRHCSGSWQLPAEDSPLVEQAYRRIHKVALEVMGECNAQRGLPQHSGDETGPQPHDGPAKLHDGVLEQLKQRLKEYSILQSPGASSHKACSELLLLLQDYLRCSSQHRVIDTACFMLGACLMEQEHMLRATRMQLWPWEAVLHMDSLVQLYTEMLTQVTSPAASAWLLQLLGTRVGASPLMRTTGGAGSPSGSTSAPAPAALVPADTLQLVLDFLQRLLAKLSVAADNDATASTCFGSNFEAAGSPLNVSIRHLDSPTAAMPHTARSSCSTISYGAGQPRTPVQSARDGNCGDAATVTPALHAATVRLQPNAYRQVIQMKAHCWRLLETLLQLALQQSNHRAEGAASNARFNSCPGIHGSSFRRNSLCLQEPCDRAGSNLRPPLPFSPLASPSGARGRPKSISDASTPGGVLSSGKRPCVPLLPVSSTGDRLSLRLPNAAGLAIDVEPSELLPAQSSSGYSQYASISGSSSSMSAVAEIAPGRCGIWQLLVELLMTHSRSGQAYVLQQLADANGSAQQLPLQQALANFLAAVLGVPNSYPVTKPQLAEFYVHHHFLQFTQHYHRLPTTLSQVSGACCRSHIQVLLALCHQIGGGHVVRRRFLQLKVLDFLVREASLEYMLQHKQLALSFSSRSSCCSTPESTSRTSLSGRGLGGLPARDCVGGNGIPSACLPIATGGGPAVPGKLSARSNNAPSWLVDNGLGCRRTASARGSQCSFNAGAVLRARGSTADDDPLPTGRSLPAMHRCNSSTIAASASLHPAAHEVFIQNLQLRLESADAPQQSSAQSCRPSRYSCSDDVPAPGSVRSAVKVFEAAAALAGGSLGPTAPKQPAASAAARRQPGQQRLIRSISAGGAPIFAAAVQAAADADAASATPDASSAVHHTACTGDKPDSHRPAKEQEEGPIAHSASTSSKPAFVPHPPEGPKPSGGARMGPRQGSIKVAVPKLNLKGSSLGATSSGRSSRAAGGTHGCAAVDADGRKCSPPAVPALSIPALSAVQSSHLHIEGSLISSSTAAEVLSPRADLGAEAPASMLSQRRLKPPQLTGDASLDSKLIDAWEEQTGLEFTFDGLSDHEASSSGRASPADVTSARAVVHCHVVSKPTGSQAAAPAASVAVAKSRAVFPATGAPGMALSVPRLNIDNLMPPATSSGWPSNKTGGHKAAGLTALLEPFPSTEYRPACSPTAYCMEEEAEAAHHSKRRSSTSCTPANVTVTSSSANAYPANLAGSYRELTAAAVALPVLQVQEGTATAGGAAAAAATGAAWAQIGAEDKSPAVLPSPGAVSSSGSSYKPGWDLEEDFERMLREEDEGHQGCWGFSDGEDSDGSGLIAAAIPESPHQPAREGLQAQCHLQLQQELESLQPPEKHQVAASPLQDTCLNNDKTGIKCRSPSKAKQQAIISGAACSPAKRWLKAGPVAFALQDEDWVDSGDDGSEDGGGAGSTSREVEGDHSRRSSFDHAQEAATSAASLLQDGDVDLDPSTPTVRGGGRALLRPLPASVPRLKLPRLSQSLHVPMSAAVLDSPSSSRSSASCEESSSSASSANSSPVQHGHVRMLPQFSLMVAPLATTRGACSSPKHSVRNSKGHRLEQAAHKSTRAAAAESKSKPLHVVAAPTIVAPGAAVAHEVQTAVLDPLQARYAAQRQRCAMYADAELHVMCMELALHLLVTPAGVLDPVQLPKEPADTSLQRKVLLLVEHFSCQQNFSVVCRLIQKAQASLHKLYQQPHQQSQQQLPQQRNQHSILCPSIGHDSKVDVRLQQGGAASHVGITASSSEAPRQPVRSSRSDDHQQLLLPAAYLPVPFRYRPGRGAAGGSSNCSSGRATAAAVEAAAGLASSTLRLLKLLSVATFNASSLNTSSMISKGAFSEVLAGTLQQANGSCRSVAVKVLDCSEDDACSFERVYNEVAVLETLHEQPGVIPLLEYGISSSLTGERQWLLVFPRYSSSLREWRMHWRGPGLDVQDLPVYLRLFVQVAHTVAALHTANVVHFDIKGDNLLLEDGFSPGSMGTDSSRSCSSSSSSSVVLADFGDALMLEDVQSASQRHRGTELFSSPEMLLLHAGRQHAQHAQHDRRKHRGIHAAHDVWSLGCTLYELLTGTVLFEEEGVGRITSYGSIQSLGGAPTGGRREVAGGWGVLNAKERAALGHHAGCIDLVESMLVGEPTWRPAAEQVAARTQRLLDAVLYNCRR